MPAPRSVDLELTARCNLRCRYCYYLNNEGVQYRDLPTHRWLEFLQELGEAKVMTVCLAGGEPFVRSDILQIIDGIIKNRMRFRMLTNGCGITRETAIRLRETRRCDLIQVSLDGSRREIHEKLRGNGSFEPALGAITILKQEGLPITVRVTVHPYNIGDLPAIARLLLEEIGIATFSTNSVSCLGTRAKYGEDVFLRPAERLSAMRVLASLDEQYPGRIFAAAGPLANWRRFHEMESVRKRHESIPGRGYLVGCGCIFSRIAVRADGAYVPCVMLPQMVLGYIGSDSITGIWRNSPQLTALRNRVNIPLEGFPECMGCEYVGSCTGNCAGSAFSLLGDPNRPSPDDCLRRFLQELILEGISLW